MKNLLCLLLALALTVGCLPLSTFGEDTNGSPIVDDAPALTEPEPDLAEDAQAPQTDFAFGSVSIFNGCRTLDGQVPLAGSDRKLESAQSAIVYERNTKTLVYAYNPDMKLAPGSLSKIITALVVVERVPDLDAVVTVGAGIASRIPGGATSAKLKSEEQMPVRDLLHLLILQNAADAAVALAEYVAGVCGSDESAGQADRLHQHLLYGCARCRFRKPVYHCPGYDPHYDGGYEESHHV